MTNFISSIKESLSYINILSKGQRFLVITYFLIASLRYAVPFVAVYYSSQFLNDVIYIFNNPYKKWPLNNLGMWLLVMFF